jgi:TonB-linked SusC/RagA family outer membrane protein
MAAIPSPTKTLSMMKWTLLLMLATCLQAAASGFSQTIDLTVKNASAEQVFRRIEQQTSLGFIYAREQLTGLRTYDISVRSASVAQVMDILFRDTPLTYVISGNNVVIKQREIPRQTEVQTPPPVTVTGRVTDEDGQPLAQVSVVVKSTGKGTSTDADGRYTVELPDGGGVLVFSFVGYDPVEYRAGQSTAHNLVLKRSLARTEEIVVVGYGSQKKKDVTGSVASLPKERLQQLPNTNIAQALQGAVPGLLINTNSGAAEGNDLTIDIRGRNSISASNGPLIIWDGIPYTGGISEINPNDVESIEILKDASAAAIYGSRGANGVILITSKQGRKGRLNITYDGFYGTQTIINKPDLMTGPEFYEFKKSRLNIPPTAMTPSEEVINQAGNWVDWYDLATQQGTRSQHSLSVAGGSDRISFYLGATYLDVKGIAVNDQFRRYSLRPGVDVKITDWLSMGSSSQLSFQDRSGLPATFSGDFGANYMNPLTTAIGPDGKPTVYAWPEYNTAGNPLGNLLAINRDNSYRLFSSNYAKVDFPFVKGLSYRLNAGVEFDNNQRKTYSGVDTKDGFENNGEAVNYNSVERNVTLENLLTYARTFDKHNLNFTGLYSSQSNDFDRDQLVGVGFPNDVLTNYQMNAAKLLTPSSAQYRQAILSQMVRLNYGYDSRYLLTVTARRDGYSGFGDDTKFGWFPSFALAWNLGSERFLSNFRAMNSLKLRASYGMNGNQAVSSYQSLATLSTRGYLSGTSLLTGYVPNRLANEQLGWESTRTLTLGVDFAFLSNRIQGSLDYYSARTEDLLLERNISSVQGFTRILQNIGKTANRGVELALNTVNVKSGNFSWSTNLNLSHNTNEIVDLYGDGKDDVGNRWFIGKPIRVIYGLKYDGVFKSADEVAASAQKASAKPGYVRVLDADGDGTINTAADRMILGNQDPRLIWGMTNNFKMGPFTLMVFFHGVTGVTKENPTENDAVYGDVRLNTTKKDWWSDKNPSGTHFANDALANQFNVGFFERSDFIRFKDLSLAYQVPTKLLQRMHLNTLKVYMTGRNLATFTKYRGLDPEITNQLGVPLQREIVVGVNLSL